MVIGKLHDQILDGHLASARMQDVDFCHSCTQFATSLSDHEVKERRKDRKPQTTQQDKILH